MKKITIKKKSMLEMLKTERVRISMDTSQKIIPPDKGKGSYNRKVKHKKKDSR